MRLEELERELRAERSEPDSEFTRRLDEWAAAGFPRDRGLGPRLAGPARPGGGALARVWDRLASAPRRRVLMPVGAAATLLVVVGVAISQSGDIGGGSDDTAVSGPSLAIEGEAGRESAGAAEAGDARREGSLLSRPRDTQSLEGSGGSARATAPEQAIEPAPLPPLPPPDGGGGGIARGTENRIFDATARISLGAEADEVQEVANGVVEVADRYNGVVLDSQVTTDQAGARAAFTLEIPFKQLDAALADLSGLADVISRTEAGEDITARAVRARKNLSDLFDQIRKARIELIRADTREERLIIKAQISSLQASADAAEAELNNVKRQGRFATVSVDVTSNGAESDSGDWTLSDALDDAGRVLEVLGGIALITLAVLVPLALVGTLAWLVVTRAQHRRRERALDQ